MTNVIVSKWTNAVNGAYAVAANWTPNGVPSYVAGTEFDVFIGGAYTSGSAAFTVTSATSEQVGFLDIGANATLSVTGGRFQIYSHVNSYSNAYNYGTISVAAGAALATTAVSQAHDKCEPDTNDKFQAVHLEIFHGDSLNFWRHTGIQQHCVDLKFS